MGATSRSSAVECLKSQLTTQFTMHSDSQSDFLRNLISGESRLRTAERLDCSPGKILQKSAL